MSQDKEPVEPAKDPVDETKEAEEESEDVPVDAAGAAIAIRVLSAETGPRIAPQADDSDDEEEEEEVPRAREVRLPRRMAGVCDVATWRKFVAAVFDTVVDVSEKILLPHEHDVMPNVRAMIEGMSFSTESSKFSTLGMEVGVPGATPQCIDLLGGLMRVTAKRAASNPEYAKLFADPVTLKNHLEQVGAQVCALPHVQVWMVIAAASARAEVWNPVMRRRKADEVEIGALARMAASVADDPVEREEPPLVMRAGGRGKKRKLEEQ